MNNQTANKIRRILFKAAGVLLLLAVWQFFADVFAQKGMEVLLASPFRVLLRLITLLREQDFLTTVMNSSLRVFSGFFIAFVVGIILGSLAGEFMFIENFLWFTVATVKAVPVAAFIVILFNWFDMEIIPILTFFIAFPIVYGNVLQGVRCADKKLLEVADVYKVSYLKKVIFIKIPAFSNYLVSASSTAIGMAWKAGIAAELIIQLNGSIGDKIYYTKAHMLNEDLLAWTIVIIVASLVFEKVFVLLLKLLFARFYRI